MKKVAVIMVVLFMFSAIVSAYVIPDLDDYIFKYENGVLYWCEKSDYIVDVGNINNWNFPKDMSDKDKQKTMMEYGQRIYNWKKEIPGPLLKRLIENDWITTTP